MKPNFHNQSKKEEKKDVQLKKEERGNLDTSQLKEALKKAIETGNITQQTVEKCKDFAERYKNITTSQLRLFFGELRRLEMKGLKDNKDNKSSFALLKAKLAYSAAKSKSDKKKGKIMHNFYLDMEEILNAVGGDDDKFSNFMKIIEAIVAYHKYFEAFNSKESINEESTND